MSQRHANTNELIAAILKESSEKQKLWAAAFNSVGQNVKTENPPKIDPTSLSRPQTHSKPTKTVPTSTSTPQPTPAPVSTPPSAGASPTSTQSGTKATPVALPTVRIPLALKSIDETAGERVVLSGTRGSTSIYPASTLSTAPLTTPPTVEHNELVKTVTSLGQSSSSSSSTAEAGATLGSSHDLPRSKSPLRARARGETMAMVPPPIVITATASDQGTSKLDSNPLVPTSPSPTKTRPRSFSTDSKPPLGVPLPKTSNIRPNRSPSRLLQMYSAKRLQISAVAEHWRALAQHENKKQEDDSNTLHQPVPVDVPSALLEAPIVSASRWASDSDSERDFLKATSVLDLKRQASRSTKEGESEMKSGVVGNGGVQNSPNNFLAEPLNAKPATSVYTDDGSSLRAKSEDPGGSGEITPKVGADVGTKTTGIQQVGSDSGVFVIPKLPLMQALQPPDMPNIVISNGENSVSFERLHVFGPPSPEAHNPLTPDQNAGKGEDSNKNNNPVGEIQREGITAKQRLKQMREEKEQKKAKRTQYSDAENELPIVGPLQTFTELDRQAHISKCLKSYRMDAVRMKNTLLHAFAGIDTSTLKRMAGHRSSSDSDNHSDTSTSSSRHSAQHSPEATAIGTHRTSSTLKATTMLLNNTKKELKELQKPDPVTSSLIEEHRARNNYDPKTTGGEQATPRKSMDNRPLSRKAYREQKEQGKFQHTVGDHKHQRATAHTSTGVDTSAIVELSPIQARAVSSSLAREGLRGTDEAYKQLIAAIPVIKLVTPSTDGSDGGSLERMISVPVEQRPKAAPTVKGENAKVKTKVAQSLEPAKTTLPTTELTEKPLTQLKPDKNSVLSTLFTAGPDGDKPVISRKAYKEEKERLKSQQLAQEKLKEANEAQKYEREKILQENFTAPQPKQPESQIASIIATPSSPVLTEASLLYESKEDSSTKATAIALWVQESIDSASHSKSSRQNANTPNSPKQTKAQTARIDSTRNSAVSNGTHTVSCPANPLIDIKKTPNDPPIEQLLARNVAVQNVAISKRSVTTLSQISTNEPIDIVLSQQTSAAFGRNGMDGERTESMKSNKAGLTNRLADNLPAPVNNYSFHSVSSLSGQALMASEREPSPAQAMPSELLDNPAVQPALAILQSFVETKERKESGHTVAASPINAYLNVATAHGNIAISSPGGSDADLFREAPEQDSTFVYNPSDMVEEELYSTQVQPPELQGSQIGTLRHREHASSIIIDTKSLIETNPTQEIMHSPSAAEPFSRSGPASPIRSPPPPVVYVEEVGKITGPEVFLPEPFVRSPDTKNSFSDVNITPPTSGPRILPSARRVKPPESLILEPTNAKNTVEEDINTLPSDSILGRVAENLLASSPPSSPTIPRRPSFMSSDVTPITLPSKDDETLQQEPRAIDTVEFVPQDPFMRSPVRLFFNEGEIRAAKTVGEDVMQPETQPTPAAIKLNDALPPLSGEVVRSRIVHKSPTKVPSRRRGTPSRRRPTGTNSATHLDVYISDDEDFPKVSDVDENGAYRVKILSRSDRETRSSRQHGSPQRSTSNQSSTNGASRSSKATTMGGTAQTGTIANIATDITPTVVFDQNDVEVESAATTEGSKNKMPTAIGQFVGKLTGGTAARDMTGVTALSSTAQSEQDEKASARRLTIRKEMHIALESSRLNAQETAARGDIKRQQESVWRSVRAEMMDAEDRVILRLSMKAARRQIL